MQHLLPVVEYNAPLMTVHQAHAAPAPTVEYDAALTEEYDAYAERADPSPLMDGPVVKVVPVPQVQIAEKTMEITQFQTIEEIVDTPEIQTLEAVLHELELGCFDLKEISYHGLYESKAYLETRMAQQAQHQRMLQSLRGHGEGFRNVYVMRRSFSR